jgi:hypothetical protein
VVADSHGPAVGATIGTVVATHSAVDRELTIVLWSEARVRGEAQAGLDRLREAEQSSTVGRC